VYQPARAHTIDLPPMLRFIILVLVIALIVKLARDWLTARPAEKRRIPPHDAGRMVRCEQCGLYVPENEAVKDDDGLTFCSEAHRRQHHRS
jgi:uncharacterized protein